MLTLEAATEVARGRRIGDPQCTEQIKVGFVLAPQFEILQARSRTQGIVCQVEHVVRLMIGEMHFEQVQPLVDRFGQPQRADQLLYQSDAAEHRTRAASRQFILDLRGAQHGHNKSSG